MWDILAQPSALRLTLTLMHFLWQGTLVAAALALLLGWLPLGRAASRYALALAALVLMACCPLATWLWLDEPPVRPALEVERTGPVEPNRPVAAHAVSDLPAGPSAPPVLPWPPAEAAEPLVDEQAAAVVGQQSGERVASGGDAGAAWVGSVHRVQPFLLAGWLGGVLLLSIRLLAGLAGVRWLRMGSRPLPADWAAPVEKLHRRLGIDRAVRVCTSERVSGALVAGLWRPVVLLPGSWLLEMTPPMLEAVIAHELAHIRRRDLWVNLFQRVLETLFFYHPAVWWVSRRLHVEREMCCDELAVAAIGQRLVYVDALQWAARQPVRGANPAMTAAMGGKKMNLLGRVRYVLGLAPARQDARWWPASLLMLLIPLAAWVASTGLTPPGQDRVPAGEPQQKKERPEKKSAAGDQEKQERPEKKPAAGQHEDKQRPSDPHDKAAGRDKQGEQAKASREAHQRELRQRKQRELKTHRHELHQRIKELDAQQRELQQPKQRERDAHHRELQQRKQRELEAHRRELQQRKQREQHSRELREREQRPRPVAEARDEAMMKLLVDLRKEVLELRQQVRQLQERERLRHHGKRPADPPAARPAGRPELPDEH